MLVLFPITLTLLLGLAGLLYTVQFTLVQRRALQTAVDAASLAGAWQVLQERQGSALSDAAVAAAIQRFGTANGLTASEMSVTPAVYVDAAGATVLVGGVAVRPGSAAGGRIPDTARGVRVTARRTVSTFLPGFLGVASAFDVEMVAAAIGEDDPSAGARAVRLVS